MPSPSLFPIPFDRTRPEVNVANRGVKRLRAKIYKASVKICTLPAFAEHRSVGAS